jgi:hypothetical protein
METKRNELEKFNHSVGVLVKAFLDDTLDHGNCGACAVGNLVADALNDKDFKVFGPMNLTGELVHGIGWAAVFCTTGKGRQLLIPGQYKGDAKKQIDATGYSWRELARIEKAFELHNPDYTKTIDIEEGMFNGLMAVVDVLADIHGVDLSVKESAKLQFVKA